MRNGSFPIHETNIPESGRLVNGGSGHSLSRPLRKKKEGKEFFSRPSCLVVVLLLHAYQAIGAITGYLGESDVGLLERVVVC